MTFHSSHVVPTLATKPRFGQSLGTSREWHGEHGAVILPGNRLDSCWLRLVSTFQVPTEMTETVDLILQNEVSISRNLRFLKLQTLISETKPYHDKSQLRPGNFCLFLVGKKRLDLPLSPMSFGSLISCCGNGAFPSDRMFFVSSKCFFLLFFFLSFGWSKLAFDFFNVFFAMLYEVILGLDKSGCVKAGSQWTASLDFLREMHLVLGWAALGGFGLEGRRRKFDEIQILEVRLRQIYEN